MTQFIDTYLKSQSKAELEALLGFVTHMIDIQQGSAAQEALGVEGEEGYVPAVPAKGDPAYFYTCVRSVFPVPAFGSIEVCDQAEGMDVVGVWG